MGRERAKFSASAFAMTRRFVPLNRSLDIFHSLATMLAYVSSIELFMTPFVSDRRVLLLWLVFSRIEPMNGSWKVFPFQHSMRHTWATIWFTLISPVCLSIFLIHTWSPFSSCEHSKNVVLHYLKWVKTGGLGIRLFQS